MAVLAAVTAIRNAWRRGSVDPLWELRWQALDPSDRARLAVAALSVTSTAALVDPERRALAEGFGRRERQRRAYFDLLLLVVLALVAALMLTGVTSFSALGSIIAMYLGLRVVADWLRDEQIKRRVRTAYATKAPA